MTTLAVADLARRCALSRALVPGSTGGGVMATAHSVLGGSSSSVGSGTVLMQPRPVGYVFLREGMPEVLVPGPAAAAAGGSSTAAESSVAFHTGAGATAGGGLMAASASTANLNFNVKGNTAMGSRHGGGEMGFQKNPSASASVSRAITSMRATPVQVQSGFGRSGLFQQSFRPRNAIKVVQ